MVVLLNSWVDLVLKLVKGTELLSPLVKVLIGLSVGVADRTHKDVVWHPCSLCEDKSMRVDSLKKLFLSLLDIGERRQLYGLGAAQGLAKDFHLVNQEQV